MVCNSGMIIPLGSREQIVPSDGKTLHNNPKHWSVSNRWITSGQPFQSKKMYSKKLKILLSEFDGTDPETGRICICIQLLDIGLLSWSRQHYITSLFLNGKYYLQNKTTLQVNFR